MKGIKSVRGGLLPAGSVAFILTTLLALLPKGDSSAQGSQSFGEIILACGPGTVLTQDGTIWVYRPDHGEWLTIDRSFAESEGRKTKVLPLPVPVANIADMASFGFIVTRTGTCWLYDLEKDHWREVGSPPRQR
jgi:hypothetical protein